jgi:hypothetical protein
MHACHDLHVIPDQDYHPDEHSPCKAAFSTIHALKSRWHVDFTAWRTDEELPPLNHAFDI